MSHLLAGLWRLLRRNLLLFVLIVLILSTGKWVVSEWSEGQTLIDQLPALRAAQQDVTSFQAALGSTLTEQGRQLSGATIQQLDQHIATLDQDIARLQHSQAPVSLSGVMTGTSAPLGQQLQRQARLGIELELRRQLRAHLVEVRAHAQAVGNRRAALERLEQLRLAHVGVYGQLRRSEQELQRLRTSAGWFAAIPGTRSYRKSQAWRESIEHFRAANSHAHQAFLQQQRLLDRLALPAVLTPFRIRQQRAEAETRLHDQLLRAEALAANNVVWRAYQAARPVFPLALGILVAWTALPAALRTLFYFVLAPLAARLPPVVLAPGAPGPRYSAFRSAVSLTLTVGPDEDLVCRPDYFQSQPHGASVRTRILFDWRHALTCLAARLWMLTQLQPHVPSQVVLSATRDPFDELAVVELPAGAALVLQPRALVGMLHARGQRPLIRSHWRIGTLHAWLTLQLRYLVFEGPAQLIVRGCRGVRLEQAQEGRVISQEATLGFSANARYGTLRSKPFLAYLRGLQPLFHDRFQGEHAVYLYEEVPRSAQAGTRANPVGVLMDAGLKAFGI